ncbi:MAG: polysaccharide deacetylase family protein [Bdellovibrionota bacterium]
MNLKKTQLLALAALMSCSTNQYVAYKDQDVAKEQVSRSVANTKVSKDFTKKVASLTKSIYHSYLYGQVLLEKYDLELDKDPAKANSGSTYSELLSVRTFVDQFEEEINDLYVHLVLVSAMPEHSDEQKANAQAALAQIGTFLDGIRTDGKELPENLRPMVLSNLTEKQTQLYDLLKATRDGMGSEKGMEEARKVIWDNMILLRATRRAYNKDLASYEVDPAALSAAVEEASKDKDFKSFQKDVKTVSKDIKKLIQEIKTGRSTSSDVIFPSVGASGNITGRGFPANTWSITYDDGPGGRTTPTVLTNLANHNMKATFFMLAQQVLALPTITKTVVDGGHDIASHSYTHAQITKLGPQGRDKEIVQSKAVIEKQTGKSIKLFRLPYGAGVSVANIRQVIADANMIHVFWNVDTLDWQDKNPQSILARALKQMSAYKGGVVLFHDIHAQSVVASNLLMDHMKKAGIIVCTVQGVVDQQNKNLPSCN